jgi:hypothetical protein
MENIKGIVLSRSSTIEGGTLIYLKKRWWLRVFHTLMMHDTSAYLLDPFYSPIVFNKDSSIIENGLCRCSKSWDKYKIAITLHVPLQQLIWYPWFIRPSNTLCTISQAEDYRRGYKPECMKWSEAKRIVDGARLFHKSV